MDCIRRSKNNQVSSILSRRLSTACYLLLFLCCLLLACGKKGDPTLKSYEKPDAPSGVTAVHRESEIILQWQFPKDKERGLRGFHIMKASDGDYKKIAVLENTGRSFTDTDFRVGSSYKYRIISESLKGVTNESLTSVINPKNPPAPPYSLSFNISHDLLSLSWKSAGGSIMFNVYKTDRPGIYSLKPVNKSPLTETSFEDSFDIRRAVYYTVRSLLGGDVRDEGPPSEEMAVEPSTLVPSAPTALEAVAIDTKVYLIWKEPPETWVSGYRVYREIGHEEGFSLIGEPQTPSFTDREPPPSPANYRVTAVGPLKEGPPAEVRNVVFEKQK